MYSWSRLPARVRCCRSVRPAQLGDAATREEPAIKRHLSRGCRQNSTVAGAVCGVVLMSRVEDLRAFQIADMLATRAVGPATKRRTKASAESLPGPKISINNPMKRKIKGSAL